MGEFTWLHILLTEYKLITKPHEWTMELIYVYVKHREPDRANLLIRGMERQWQGMISSVFTNLKNDTEHHFVYSLIQSYPYKRNNKWICQAVRDFKKRTKSSQWNMTSLYNYFQHYHPDEAHLLCDGLETYWPGMIVNVFSKSAGSSERKACDHFWHAYPYNPSSINNCDINLEIIETKVNSIGDVSYVDCVSGRNQELLTSASSSTAISKTTVPIYNFVSKASRLVANANSETEKPTESLVSRLISQIAQCKQESIALHEIILELNQENGSLKSRLAKVDAVLNNHKA